MYIQLYNLLHTVRTQHTCYRLSSHRDYRQARRGATLPQPVRSHPFVCSFVCSRQAEPSATLQQAIK